MIMIGPMATPTIRLIVSLDRSDRTAAAVYIDRQSNEIREEIISLTPESMTAWWDALLLHHPANTIAVAFELPAPNLLAFFRPKNPGAIYALNPSLTHSFRRSYKASSARNDPSDARHQALMVSQRLDSLKPWTAPAPSLVALERLTIARRKFCDERTALTNQLEAVLKRYFPQALDLLHPDRWRPINIQFLRKWPSAASLQRTPLSRLKAFYLKQGSRSETQWERRTSIINGIITLAEPDISDLLHLSSLLDMLEALNAVILKYDNEIAKSYEDQRSDTKVINSFPGAGPVLGPRLFVAVARYAPNCTDSTSFAAAVGIAPVTNESGKSRKIYRRLQCDNHTRQTFVEWTNASWKMCSWANAYVRDRLAKGQAFNSIMRSLAYKWIRILWKCWQDRSYYDDSRYIEHLRSKGSPLVRCAA